jgi:acyl-CoA thioesterase
MPPARRTGFVEWIGLTETALRPGEVRCDLTVDERHQNIQGVIHGSVVIGLLDTAMGHALTSLLADDEFCSTTQLSVQFHRAARPGEHLSAVGRVTKKGNRIAYLEGTCTNAAGDDVARAHGTWYVGRVEPGR